jgi:hypothetical protein
MDTKIKNELDKYLEFDSSQLFIPKEYLVAFGGSLRDIISGNKINDIDILCLGKSMERAIKVIENEGYVFTDLFSRDILNMYDDIHVIFEPKTYMNARGKKIQFIRPSMNEKCSYNSKSAIFEFSAFSYFELLKNVDLSCCGLFWDGETLYESYIGSVKHCMEKKFLVLEDNLMYNSNRIDDRKRKMFEKGFDEILLRNLTSIKKERMLKLNDILSENNNMDDYKEKMGYDAKIIDKIMNKNDITYSPYNSIIDDDDLPF